MGYTKVTKNLHYTNNSNVSMYGYVFSIIYMSVVKTINDFAGSAIKSTQVYRGSTE